MTHLFQTSLHILTIPRVSYEETRRTIFAA